MSQKKHELLLGAHLSIAGGLKNALLDGQKIGCTCVQIFTHSNRQWKIKPLSTDDIEDFYQAKKETGINHIVVHASYLLQMLLPLKKQPGRFQYKHSFKSLNDARN